MIPEDCQKRMEGSRRDWEKKRRAVQHRFLLASGLFALVMVIVPVGGWAWLLSLPAEMSWLGWGPALVSFFLCLWAAHWFLAQLRRFHQQIESLRQPTAAILLVTLATLPGRVLVLWQKYRQGLQEDLVGEGQIGNRIISLLQAGVVILAVRTGGVIGANDLLPYIDDDLGQLARTLGDEVATLPPIFARRLRDEEALTRAMSPGW